MISKTRPVGPVVDFSGVLLPDLRDLTGQYVRLERLDVDRHGPALWSEMRGHDHIWDYLFEEPPQDEATFLSILTAATSKEGWLGYAICQPDGTPQGYAFYLNIVLPAGTIEVGNINFAPALQTTRAATEAMFLMMQEVFALGYRRYEWKCNALNRPSRRAAQRFGFSWEGIFRQHMVVKSRNRDTAWLAMTDQDWPNLRTAFETWLSPDNFDAKGQQILALRGLTEPLLVARDPAQ